MKWTESEEDTLIKLWNEGVLLKHVSARLGRNVLAIQYKRHLLALPGRKRGTQGEAWKPEVIETLSRMWSQGYSASQIANELPDGISRNAVTGKVHRLGIAERSVIAKPGEKKAKKVSASSAKSKRAAARPKAKARVSAPSVSEPEAIPATGITIDEIPMRGRCRWPHGDPSQDSFRYCGHKTGFTSEGTNRVYCDTHHAVAHIPDKPKRKRSASMERFLDCLTSKRVRA